MATEPRPPAWKEATALADEFFTKLRAEHPPGFVRIVLRALERRLRRENKALGVQDVKSGKPEIPKPDS